MPDDTFTSQDKLIGQDVYIYIYIYIYISVSMVCKRTVTKSGSYGLVSHNRTAKRASRSTAYFSNPTRSYRDKHNQKCIHSSATLLSRFLRSHLSMLLFLNTLSFDTLPQKREESLGTDTVMLARLKLRVLRLLTIRTNGPVDPSILSRTAS